MHSDRAAAERKQRQRLGKTALFNGNFPQTAICQSDCDKTGAVQRGNFRAIRLIHEEKRCKACAVVNDNGGDMRAAVCINRDLLNGRTGNIERAVKIRANGDKSDFCIAGKALILVPKARGLNVITSGKNRRNVGPAVIGGTKDNSVKGIECALFGGFDLLFVCDAVGICLL